MTDAELLAAALEASGLSVRKFAALIGRNGRTVFAWKAKGEALSLPVSVRERLKRLAHPKELTEEEARSLLTKVVNTVRAGCIKRGDTKGAASLSGSTAEIVDRMIAARKHGLTIDELRRQME